MGLKPTDKLFKKLVPTGSEPILKSDAGQLFSNNTVESLIKQNILKESTRSPLTIHSRYVGNFFCTRNIKKTAQENVPNAKSVLKQGFFKHNIRIFLRIHYVYAVFHSFPPFFLFKEDFVLHLKVKALICRLLNKRHTHFFTKRKK